MRFRSSFVSAFTLLSTATAQTPPTLEHVLTTNRNLTTFYDLINEKYPDLLSVLEAQRATDQPITILAPSNDAFDKIPDSSIGGAFNHNDTDAVREVLMYHILPGEHPTGSFGTTFQFLSTWLSDPSATNVTSGQRVSIVQQTPEYVFVSGLGTRSTITTPDIYFTGGILHVIDMPVIPPVSYPETAEDFNITSFLGADYQNETLASLMNLTSDITIFAPSNEAMNIVTTSPLFTSNDTLSSLIDYHIILSPLGPLYSSFLTNGSVFPTLSGDNVTITFASNSLFINSARIIQEDLLLANGVLHVIDTVLDPAAVGVAPNPELATAAPLLPLAASTATPFGAVPFTSAIPDLTATLNPSSSTSSSGAAASSTGVAAMTTDLSAATSTDGYTASATRRSAAAQPVRSSSSKTIIFATILLTIFGADFLS